MITHYLLTWGPSRRRREAQRQEASNVQPVSTSERDGHKLLRYAQEGNIRALKDLLRCGYDVNFRDDFYWTGVMCASKAGKTEAVRLLLQHGAAWVGVVDKQVHYIQFWKNLSASSFLKNLSGGDEDDLLFSHWLLLIC